MTVHSHLGASGAERWLQCAGSTTLIQRFGKPEEQGDGPEYRWQGTVAHAAIADCLTNDLEAWEVVGREYEGHALTAEIAEGVAFYLATVRPYMEPENTYVLVEQHLSEPTLHPALFGTVDLAVVRDTTLWVFDYKNGAGVSVAVEENPQVMYYAFLMLRKLADRGIREVVLTIVQPNDFNPAGKVRTWATFPEVINHWAETTLLPAMHKADQETGLQVGPHCRFCPAKLICPAQQSVFGYLSQAQADTASAMTDAELSRTYTLLEPARMFIKAVEEETFARLMRGVELADAKLVKKQADRIWRDGALERFSTLFGTRAFTDPKLKSPAEMEKLPQAKALVRELAYTPDTGLTVKPMSAKGLAQKPPKASTLLQSSDNDPTS